jgi:hypothetical protein
MTYDINPIGSESRAYRCPETGELLLKVDRIHLDLIIPPTQGSCPWVIITEEMFEEAESLIPKIQLHNQRANSFDSFTGTIGELAFAKWLFEDFRNHNVGKNFGKSDFPGIEIKTSLATMSDSRHLIAKANYVESRPAEYYIQCFINSSTPQRGPLIGDTVFIAGWLTKGKLLEYAQEHWEITRKGEETGIRTLRVPLPFLEPMDTFREAYKIYLNQEGK